MAKTKSTGGKTLPTAMDRNREESCHGINHCESLRTTDKDCDIVNYIEFIELQKIDAKGISTSLIHPQRVLQEVKRYADRLEKTKSAFQALSALHEDKSANSLRVGIPGLRNYLEKQSRHERITPAGKSESKSKGKKTAKKDLMPKAFDWDRVVSNCNTPQPLAMNALNTSMGNALGKVQNGVFDAISEIVSDAAAIASAASPDNPANPRVILGATYRQNWCSKGYERGRLLRSIPLPPDGRKEIVVKSWNTRKQRREENQSVDEDISTEFVGDEKWSLATTKEVSATMNQQINAGLKANADATIPVKSVPVKVGGSGHLDSSTSGTLSASLKQTEEDIHQTTSKSANALKKSVSSKVETADESGLETTLTETLVNPNKCHSLTFHFFEVLEHFEIETRLDRLNPYLLIPLQRPVINLDWVLCHECLLKRYITCDLFYRGFEAAKRLRINEHLGLFQGTLDDPGINDTADQLLNSVGGLLAAYSSLANAGLLPVGGVPAPGPQPAPPGDGGNPWNDAWEWISGNWERLQGDSDDPAEAEDGNLLNTIGEVAKGTVEAVGGAIEAGKETVESGWNWLTGQTAQTQQGANLLFSMQAGSAPATAPGGVGSYIYWQVAHLTAPQLESALSGLDQSFQQIKAMEPGPQRTQRLLNALGVFFSTLGNVDELFQKIDTALFYLLAGTVLAGFAGSVLIASLAAAVVLITGGGAAVAAIGAAATFLGVTTVGALTGLGSTIMVALGDDIVNVDLRPDDRGLKSVIQGLYAIYQQLGFQTGEAPLPQDASPEAIAAYERQRQERKREQRELAEARVEFDRLACHLNENITYYHQMVAQAAPESWVRDLLTGDFGIPAYAVEARFSGFVGSWAAVRVYDLEWLKRSGLDFNALVQDEAIQTLFDAPRKSSDVRLPTRGVVSEPVLGECNGCDEFVREHRRIDLAIKSEQAHQARLESERFAARLAAGDLQDPVVSESGLNVLLNDKRDGQGGD